MGVVYHGRQIKQHFEIEGQTNFNATPSARKPYTLLSAYKKIKHPQIDSEIKAVDR